MNAGLRSNDSGRPRHEYFGFRIAATTGFARPNFLYHTRWGYSPALHKRRCLYRIRRSNPTVLSGDAADRSTPEEYQAAFELVDGIVKRFGLDPNRIIIAPGNHDLNWDLSKQAYAFVFRSQLPHALPAGKYIPAGDAGALLRDEEKYHHRFDNFDEHFYRRIYSVPYPLDYVEQAMLFYRNDDHLVFLAMNSCWQLDHEYRTRSSVHMGALSRALGELQDHAYDDWIKVAVWHHPVTGKETMNDDFMQLLAVHGFQICMHGHIHEALEGFYYYDPKRSIHIIGAGTFGAPARDQVPGIPLQYNLLVLDREARKFCVQTRKKEKPDGAWSADARWGDKNNPKNFYEIALTNSKAH